MRLIDADAFKKYCTEGLENMRSCFKTDDGLELAIKTTESFLKDIDEQPTVEAIPVSKINEAIGRITHISVKSGIMYRGKYIISVDDVVNVLNDMEEACNGT